MTSATRETPPGTVGRRRSWIGRLAGSTLARGATTLADQGIVSLTNFLTGVIVGRYCSRGELGLYSLAFSLLLLIVSFQSALVSMPYTVYCVRVSEEDRAAYSGSTLVHQLSMAVLSMVVLAVASPLLAARMGPRGLAQVVLVLACAAPFFMGREYLRQLFFARLERLPPLLLDAVVAIVQLGALLALARSGRLSAAAAYVAAGVACACGLLVSAMTVRRWFAWSRARVVPDLRMNWATGKWTFANGLVALAGAQLYPWIIAASRGAEEAGVLAACMGVTYLTNPLVLGLGNFLAPHAMHAHASGGFVAVRRILRNATLGLTGVMAVVCPALFIVGGTLLRLIYGARYDGYGLTVGALSLAQAIDVLAMPASYTLFLFDRPDVIVKSNFIVLGVTVTAGVVLVRLLGPLGVALGLLSGNGLAAIFRWRAYSRLAAALATEQPLVAPATLSEVGS